MFKYFFSYLRVLVTFFSYVQILFLLFHRLYLNLSHMFEYYFHCLIVDVSIFLICFNIFSRISAFVSQFSSYVEILFLVFARICQFSSYVSIFLVFHRKEGVHRKKLVFSRSRSYNLCRFSSFSSAPICTVF